MRKIDAYKNGVYFASSTKFKTCKEFKAYLEAKYKGYYAIFRCVFAN